MHMSEQPRDASVASIHTCMFACVLVCTNTRISTHMPTSVRRSSPSILAPITSSLALQPSIYLPADHPWCIEPLTHLTRLAYIHVGMKRGGLMEWERRFIAFSVQTINGSRFVCFLNAFQHKHSFCSQNVSIWSTCSEHINVFFNNQQTQSFGQSKMCCDQHVAITCKFHQNTNKHIFRGGGNKCDLIAMHQQHASVDNTKQEQYLFCTTSAIWWTCSKHMRVLIKQTNTNIFLIDKSYDLINM